VDKKYIWSKG